MIPYGKQDISKADLEAVSKALSGDWLTQGPTINQFETAMAEKVNAKFASAVNSATSALHIACMALDVGAGDWVWTSPNSFAASSNCALYCGADVDFVDINPETFNMCPDKLEEKLIQAKKDNKLPKVVIPVHFSGQSCDMEKIHQLSKEFSFRIIEDASHAVGATYKGEPVGNCKYSDIAVFSFHPVKMLTTLEGGLALTNDQKLHNRLMLGRSHGIEVDEKQFQGPCDGPWHKEQQLLGYNYRMTDVQCALGLSQLDRLDSFVAKRREVVTNYEKLLAELPIKLPKLEADMNSSWHLYVIRTKDQNRKKVFENLRANGIGVQVHYMPIYKHHYYVQRYGEMSLPGMEDYYSRCISIPIYTKLTLEDQETVASKLSEALKQNS